MTSMCLIVTGSALIPSTHEPSHGAGQIASGEFREVVGGVKPLDGFLPLTAVDQVVPVRNDVAERTTLMAEGNAAVHAARCLRLQLVFRKVLVDFLPVVDALLRPAGAPV